MYWFGFTTSCSSCSLNEMAFKQHVRQVKIVFDYLFCTAMCFFAWFPNPRAEKWRIEFKIHSIDLKYGLLKVAAVFYWQYPSLDRNRHNTVFQEIGFFRSSISFFLLFQEARSSEKPKIHLKWSTHYVEMARSATGFSLALAISWVMTKDNIIY